METVLYWYAWLGALAAIALPVVALANVLLFGKLNVSAAEYNGKGK
jgi:hypothetical protein